ncbi:MAG: DUF58 domain-containing protein [Fimbriimonadaceae bacterium]|nr:DUF58 domain-containing protein [Fimbriimonadaceae bacterium]
MMSRIAGLTITASALFLLMVAIMLGSAALFYMCTAMILTLAASRLQAWLSVRGLHFERIVPETAIQGERIQVEILVGSDLRIRRPLITVRDNLGAKIGARSVTPSLPIAPSAEQPIRTQYQFRPMRRGRHSWKGVQVSGTDALGLVTMTKDYETETAEMLVLPAPIPVSVDLPAGAGWGLNDLTSGLSRGPGIEPYGVREYIHGDSLRFVHWRSSARAGRLLVREFETGSNASVVFLFQRSRGSEVGPLGATTLDAMCGHAAYLAERFLREGAKLELPQLEDQPKTLAPHERYRQILHLLAELEANDARSLAQELTELAPRIATGAVAFLFLALADPGLVSATHALRSRNIQVWPLLYDASVAGGVRYGESAASEENILRLQSGGMSPSVLPYPLESQEASA